MASDFDTIRCAAANHAACPICLDSLVSHPDEVGALTYKGKRVEAALYHRRCVGATDRSPWPKLPGGLSPMTRARVDGFDSLPPISERRRWMSFVDWNNDGKISVAELSAAVAAKIPIDEEGVERLLRQKFTVKDDIISQSEVETKVLPYLEENAAEVAVVAPNTAAPILTRSSNRSQMLEWFKHWDADGSGSLDSEELSYAVATLFFRSLGDADMATKQAVVEAFLHEACLKRGSQVTKTKFVEDLAPALLANLPAESGSGTDVEVTGSLDQLRIKVLLATTGASAELHLPAGALLGDLRRLALERLDPSAGAGSGVEAFVAGQHLDGADATSLASFPRLHNGTVVQMLVRPAREEAERLRRLREELAQEREAVRREREELERQKQQHHIGATGGVAHSAGPAQLLSVGARVRLQNIRATPELNGRFATVLRFEESSGRYVVDVEGPQGGQKSLRPEALVPSPNVGLAFAESAKVWARKVCTHVSVWAAGYEWWQLLLGAGLVLFFALSFLQVNSRYSNGGGRSRDNFGAHGDIGSSAQYRRTTSSQTTSDRFDEAHSGDDHYRRHDEDQRRHHGQRHESFDEDHYDGHTGYGGVGGRGGGLLDNLDQTTLLFLAAGFGFLCWKGIIPVQNLSFFQLYMIWQLVEPILFGGRRRRGGLGSFGGGYGGLGYGMGMGGFGRRGFF